MEITQIVQTYISEDQHYVTIRTDQDIIHIKISKEQYDLINSLIIRR